MTWYRIFLALLELSEPLQFSDTVRSTCIASDAYANGNTFDDDMAIVSGWGWTNEDQDKGIPIMPSK